MPPIPPREFVRSVRDYCREHELIASPRRSPALTGVVVGVSGGSDSLALMESLGELAAPMRLKIHVAHLDHGLRRASRDDARFVARLAGLAGHTFTLAREPVAELARRRRCSLEEAGRLARLSFFHRVARRLRAGIVAVGHHLDDQAETVLMRLLRGSSGSGLSGMAPKRLLVDPFRPRRSGSPVWLIRPLLRVSRSDVEAFLKARRLKGRLDRTNLDRGFARNRVRHELIPWLERRYNPALRIALARAAQALEEDDAVLETMAETIFRRAGRSGRGRVTVAAGALKRAPLPVRRRVLRLAVGAAGGALGRLTQVHLDAMVRLVGSSRGCAHLPGAVVVRTAGALTVTRRR